MQNYIDEGMKFIRKTICISNSLSFKAISKKNLPYFISWIAIFIWLYSYLLPMGEFRFQSQWYYGKVGGSILYFYIWLLSTGLISLLFQAKNFVPKTIVSVLITLSSFWIITFLNVDLLSRLLMMLTALCIGHIFASCIYGFLMILNNSEKFYAMLLAILIPKVLMFIKPVLNIADYKMDASVIIIWIIIHVLLCCSYFFRFYSRDIPDISTVKTPAKAYSLMPLMFVVLILNDVIAPVVLCQMEGALSLRQTEIFYFIGNMIGIMIVILLQKRYLIHVYHIINISLALLAFGFTLILSVSQNLNLGVCIAVLLGVSYSMGLINIYYLTGIIAKKIKSIRFYKLGVCLLTVYYFIGFMFQYILVKIIPTGSTTFLAVVSIGIVLIFLVMFPFFHKMLYSGEWIDDTYRSDVTTCTRLEAYLMEYKLTPCEIGVCKLLLNGFTLRQISGIQSKAYATINTYCTSIYRKLGINSRAELLLFLQDYKE